MKKKLFFLLRLVNAILFFSAEILSLFCRMRHSEPQGSEYFLVESAPFYSF